MTVCWLTDDQLTTIWLYVNYLLRMGPRWLHQTHQRAMHRRRHHRWAFWCIGRVQVGWWWQKRSQVQGIWVHRWRPSFSCRRRGAKDRDRYLKVEKNSLGHLVLQFSALTLDQTNKQNIFLMYYLKKKQKKEFVILKLIFLFFFNLIKEATKNVSFWQLCLYLRYRNFYF